MQLLRKRIFRVIKGEGKRRKSGTGRRKPYMGSLSGKLQMWLKRSPGDGSGMFLLKNGNGSLILAAQEQALRTNSVKHSIDTETPLYRLCGDSTETVGAV